MKYQVKIGDKAFEVEVGDLSARPILATVEGETFEITPEETVAALPVAAVSASVPAPAAPAAAVPAAAVSSARAVVSPLPGTIITISVKPGDSVNHGQELMVLEAMKMKNAIRATREGVVAAIHVSVGDTVRHGQALLEFKE